MFVKRDHKKFGKFLKAQRISLKISQTDAAKVAGCHAQFISNIERGLCAPPFELLKVLIGLYKLNPNSIVQRILSDEKDFLKKNLR